MASVVTGNRLLSHFESILKIVLVGSSMTALECCTLHVHQGDILCFTWLPPTHTHPRLITTDESKLDLRPCWSAVPRWTFVSLARLSHFPSALLTSPSISPYRPVFPGLDLEECECGHGVGLDSLTLGMLWLQLKTSNISNFSYTSLPIHHFSDKHTARHKQ